MRPPIGLLTHGDDAACPMVQKKEWRRCLGHQVFSEEVPPRYVRRMRALVARLHEFVVEKALDVNFGALLGDDDVWTIGQEVAELHDLLGRV